MTSVSTGISRPQSNKPAFLNVLLVTGSGDTPLLCIDVSTDGLRDDSPHLDEFIVHASLDSIDSLLVCSNS